MIDNEPKADDLHDRGLHFDLMKMTRRRALMAGAGALVAGSFGYLALRGGGGEATVVATGPDGSTCIADPTETSGPFPGDGTNLRDGQMVNVLTQSGVMREDIRASFGDMTAVADGAPMRMRIRLVDVGAGCAPLRGHAVYVWHCDAAGRYSLYDTEDSNYLRGAGVTDAAGEVAFTSIVPACYDGRWPHVHFEVFASAEDAESGERSLLISKFALPEAMVADRYATDPRYASSVANLGRVSLAGDNVFADNSPEQIVAQTLVIAGNEAAGFVASATVGIA